MNYTLLDFLTLIGALGLFLYGMKLMSEALQKVAGSKLRNFLAAMTSNRIMGVFTGLSITAIIQSSSDYPYDCKLCECRITYAHRVGGCYNGGKHWDYSYGLDNIDSWV